MTAPGGAGSDTPVVHPARGRLYDRIYAVVGRIPSGRVATYGQIAAIVGCTARVAGYAMAAIPAGSGVPWQRVINSRGAISERSGASLQRALLEREGVRFGESGRVDLEAVRWQGPGWEWLEANGFDPAGG